MAVMEKTKVTIKANVNASAEQVWKLWNDPAHIVNWNTASEDWHSPRAENDVKVGGKFNIRMEAKDGSFGFDFSGVYDKVEKHQLIEYTMDDDRKVSVIFEEKNGQTYITETFEAESQNPVEMQQSGWQAILDSFKKYADKPSTT